jgi:hypothetical protein
MVRHEAAEALGALGDVASRETIARSFSLLLARSLARVRALSLFLSLAIARALSLWLFTDLAHAIARALSLIARALSLAGSPLLRLYSRQLELGTRSCSRFRLCS